MTTIERDMAVGHRVTVDPTEIWATLPEAVKSQIGAAAVAQALGMLGYEHGLSPRQGYEAADVEAFHIIADELREAAPAAFDEDGSARRPDLTKLGIQQCRSCGCTNECGCDDRCAWSTPDLCTSCAVPTEKPGIAGSSGLLLKSGHKMDEVAAGDPSALLAFVSCRVAAGKQVTQDQRAIFNASVGRPSDPVEVLCEGGGQICEGIVTRGLIDPDSGEWIFDDMFEVVTDDGLKTKVFGWNVDTEIVPADNVDP